MQDNIPDLEEGIPLPASATEAFPELSPQEELNMRARTIKFLADIKNEALTLDDEQKEEAEDLARKMMTDPQLRPQFAKYPNETIAYLAGMVEQMNCMIVNELSDLKLYVVNKLVMEVENARDSKSRIAALKHLGDVDGVDAFKKRTELTVQVKPLAEVEQELLGVLDNLSILEGEYAPISASSKEETDGEEAAEADLEDGEGEPVGDGVEEGDK
jgi:hypothetical protein